MIDANDFIAAEQYKKYGRIIPCGECKYYKPYVWNKNNGECEYVADGIRFVCSLDFCSKAKEREAEDVQS